MPAKTIEKVWLKPSLPEFEPLLSTVCPALPELVPAKFTIQNATGQSDANSPIWNWRIGKGVIRCREVKKRIVSPECATVDC
jgi:hypothetical protein